MLEAGGTEVLQAAFVYLAVADMLLRIWARRTVKSGELINCILGVMMTFR